MDTKVDLHRFDDEILDIEKNLNENPPKSGSILLYGSSTMANWRAEGMCYQQLAPFEIVNTGFGGSTAEEAIYYYHRLVRPARPSIMVYYEGANDLSNNYTVDEVIDTSHRLFEWCRQDFPGIRFVIIPIKISPGLKISVEEGQCCNRLFSEYANQYDDTSMIDVDSLLYNSDGSHRQDIYVEDQLHHNLKGYEELAVLVRSELTRLTS